jgi:ubiquitin thioesterase protein OTUB1
MSSSAGAAGGGGYRDGATDDVIMAQEEAIRGQVAAEQPLLGEKEAPDVLLAAYAGNPAFLPKLRAFARTHSAIRRARGDGNCFYRSFLASMAESLVLAGVRAPGAAGAVAAAAAGGPAPAPPAAPAGPLQAVYEAQLARVKDAPDLLVALGYPSETVPDFLEALGEYLAGLGQPGASVEGAALAPLREGSGGGDFYIIYGARLLVALEMRANEEAYLPFILGTSAHVSVESFCAAEVEGSRVEADQPQVMALARALQARVHIAYLDASPGEACMMVTLPEGEEGEGEGGGGGGGLARLDEHLLFRPGHYDVAYPRG